MATSTGQINRWLILVSLIVGNFMATLDLTAVTIALPHIITSLGASVQDAQWVATGAFLTSSVTMPTIGWLGQRLGFRLLYVGALGVFITGSALCALSWNLESLIVSRVFQSVGTGLIQPSGMAIITRTFPPAERGAALGLWSIGNMVGATLGPTAGGMLTDVLGWRSIFMVNVPVGLALILFALVTLPGDAERAGRRGFDWPGYLGLAVFIVGLLVTVENGDEQGWGSTPILLGAIVTASALAWFIAVEWDAPNPVIPLRLFANRNFVLALVLRVFMALALFGPVFLVPLFLQRVQGRSATESGILTMPSAITMMFTAPLSGYLTDRYGGRLPTLAGFILSAYAMWLFHGVDPLFTAWQMVYVQILRGTGVSFISTPVNAIGLNAVRAEDAGYASGLLNLFQRYAGSFSVAVLSMLLHRETTWQREVMGGAALVADAPSRPDVRAALALGYTRAEAADAVGAVNRFLLNRATSAIAYQNLFFMCAVVALAGALPVLLLAPTRRGMRPARA